MTGQQMRNKNEFSEQFHMIQLSFDVVGDVHDATSYHITHFCDS